MATTVRSHSKVNLGLAIGTIRPDGFHELLTLYQTLGLHDLVTVSARPASVGRITLTTNHPHVPRDSRNTAWRMVAGALERLDLTAAVEIHIDKRLPVQGGMGAGSANAAAALIALEHELDASLPVAERLALAAEVGSDVPLFLLGGAVLGEGRGEVVSPVSGFPQMPCVVAIPEVGVSTPQAFRDWDLRSAPNRDTLERLSRAYASLLPLPGAKLGRVEDKEPEYGASGIVRNPAPRSGMSRDPENQQEYLEQPQDGNANGLAESTLLALVHAGIENDFEEVVFSHHPSLREIKRHLMGWESGQSAIYAALSGSGSALFGLYRSKADARAAQHRVQDSGVKALLTETLPRAEYWRRMFAELPPRE